jgi:energy-coupling factor transporter ATP-binding protein EcfA2
VAPLSKILPAGREGGSEFARIVDLLIYRQVRGTNRTATIFNDAAGDFHGLDSLVSGLRRLGSTGYQYKFYSSPLTDKQRIDIANSLETVVAAQRKTRLRRWVLVTPDDLVESPTRRSSGDVSWFASLANRSDIHFQIEHWGHTKILDLFIDAPAICLYYYPELVSDGAGKRASIEEVRKRYDAALHELHHDIEFVGMSVYKQSATKGVPMEDIYIPLSIVPAGPESQRTQSATRITPLARMSPGNLSVFLGDPGSGKSTLLKFLALVGRSTALQQRAAASPDDRLPIYVVLRRYADELKSNHNLSLIRYIRDSARADLSFDDIDDSFFDFYLSNGKCCLLFDGLDELPNPSFKKTVTDRIRALAVAHPGNTVIVTSRIVGYEGPFRFDDNVYRHFVLSSLTTSEIQQFVEDWYRVRIESEVIRTDNVRDLMGILRNPDDAAIRELAQNPLLLTIVALVHRIDAVLPDQRVILYQKCTETLLNTWHYWKARDVEVRNRGRTERRNRQRIEAIAHWMHERSTGTARTQRAVVPYDELRRLLLDHISNNEKFYPEDDAEPEDATDEFLDFVRQKAGLLIEVGEGQYSFLHLTFQEYLTATFLASRSETTGVRQLWQMLGPHCTDPRWHEVVRLLIAGLRSDDSQRFLVERIVKQRVRSTEQVAHSLLLGGLLIDDISAARELRGAILSKVLITTCGIETESDFAPLASLLQSLVSKDNVGVTGLRDAVASIGAKLRGEKGTALLLLLSMLGLDE